MKILRSYGSGVLSLTKSEIISLNGGDIDLALASISSLKGGGMGSHSLAFSKNEDPKLIHLNLGKSKISKKHVDDLFTVQSGGGEPSGSGIELDPKIREVLRSSRPSAKSLRPIRTFFLGVRRPKKTVLVRLEKAFP
ncbi:MAG: hypothetical protein ACPL7L_02735 [bacterium]